MAQFRESSQQSSQDNTQEQDQSLIQGTSHGDQDLVSETDSILDEIDSVLEENAEDYVRGFVQKGGQ
ncbi:ubiquitin-like protein Pup [Curtobacterium sp. S6]|uniref:ubiquitin-like protein Pup n=1 Tax=Curtobacterium sp. S6 TaxID=1479623 RepID=UPI0004AAD126|nr:ubiquitin-like protein Pup [Curtobacterium sp. S6]